MSSRVLQEDTSLLLTEASEPLVNDNFISADGFSTGSPIFQTSSISQNHSITCSAVTTNPVVISTTTIAQTHDLSSDLIVTNAIVIASGSIAQVHSIAITPILTGQPTLSTTEADENNLLTVDSFVTGQPVLNTTEISQNSDLAPVSFVTGQPLVSPVDAVEDEKSAIADFVTGNPVVETTDLTQTQNLSAIEINAGIPRLGTADDPNRILQQEIREIEQMFGGWPRRAYEVPDGRLVQAEREIEATFGDKVSVDRKAKSLIKFGKSADLTTNRETVWTVGGNETYVNTNAITHISSSSALDTQEIKLECHTVTGTGVNQQFTFLVQTVTLDGQTKVELPTPVARVSNAFNNNGTELVGRVVVYEDTAIVGGIPSDPTKIHMDIPAGFQQGFKGATTFSNQDYYILTGGFGSVSKKQDAAADFYLEVRTAGGVFIQSAAISATSSGPWSIDLDPAVIIPKNADVRITVESGSQGAVVFGVFKGYLAKVL